MENFIITKEFTESELNVPKYDIERVQFDYDPDHVVKALNEKAEIYIYKHEGKVLSMYIVRRNEDGFSCDECYYADSIKDSEDAALMDKQIAYMTAKKTMEYKKNKAVFKGTELPKLITVRSEYGWSMAACFAIIYGLLFYTVMKLAAGIAIGIAMGVCMGLCFTKKYYAYEGMVEKTSVENSED